MSARISFSQINDRLLERLFQNYAKLEGLQEQIATGKKINRPSDDPVALTQSVELGSEANRLNTYQRNIDDGLAYLGTIDTTLSTSNSLWQNMRERAIQASNDSNSAESRRFIGQEVRGMLDQMVALSNTSFKGEYVFSGNNTQVPPFEMRTGISRVVAAPGALTGDMGLTGPTLNVPLQLVDKNVDDSADTATRDAFAYTVIPGTFRVAGLTEGTDYDVDYVNGTITFRSAGAVALAGGGGIDINYEWVRRNEKDMDGVANREIEEGVTSRINTTASEVYGGKTDVNAWKGMIELLEGTMLNKPDKVRASVAKLDQSFNRSLSAQATNGSRVLRLESTMDRNSARLVHTEELKSNTEDVEFAKAVSEFTMQQAVYEASLKMGARAVQNTLVNFL